MVKYKLIDKKCRVIGVDSSFSSYVVKSKKPKWGKALWNVGGFVKITNKQLIENTYGALRSIRAKDERRFDIHNILLWYRMYPGINVYPILFDNNGELLDKCADGKTLIWKVETRLDVLLLRAGFAHTLLIARKIIISNNVTVVSNDYTSRKVVQPGYRLLMGESIVLNIDYYNKVVMNLPNIGNDKYAVYLPKYLTVNKDKGLVRLNRYPIDGEYVLPGRVRLYMKSRIK